VAQENRGNCVLLSTSSQCLNQFARFWHTTRLFCFELLTLQLQPIKSTTQNGALATKTTTAPSYFLTSAQTNILINRLHKHHSFHSKMSLMCPPFCCKTHSRRRHHSLMPDACETFRHASLYTKSPSSLLLCKQADRGRPLPVFQYTAAVDFIGRPFAKRFVLCYRTVVCPVCSVGVLWPNGSMDQNETWHGGRPRLRPHCVRRRPIAPPKGHSPNFRPHVCCSQTAGWIKMPPGTEAGLGPGDIVHN